MTPPVSSSQAQRVLRLAVSDPVQVVGEAGLTNVCRARPRTIALPRWTDVEDADGAARREVLLDDTGVRQRHRPAAELRHSGAERRVLRGQRARDRDYFLRRNVAHDARRYRGSGIAFAAHDPDFADEVARCPSSTSTRSSSALPARAARLVLIAGAADVDKAMKKRLRDRTR